MECKTSGTYEAESGEELEDLVGLEGASGSMQIGGVNPGEPLGAGNDEDEDETSDDLSDEEQPVKPSRGKGGKLSSNKDDLQEEALLEAPDGYGCPCKLSLADHSDTTMRS